ncbi:uncharacterized protein EV420DRAFT_1579878 [Desarmillaria tabescens]|uniref:Ser-Thr-rich glycosyl-phosphatidyl-inositol-anchored membrane family-domain-containing protein n=1 Tax=Armillaria tabescens TaxID=1929756 RepID=A0AA39JJD0_ARMTA|nr:uncharacterized protein EV420DRAFT_1579878 [Desarmillaria tabescens]KAK0441508.1 hypothetical protein EV420DRAFT_1579878 [Desarmillaria tabescens]
MLSILLLLPAVALALTISTPDQPVVSAANLTIKWNAAYVDEALFTVELINAAFNRQYAIANNVNSGYGGSELTVLLPAVLPGAGFTLQLVNPGNINDVYAESGQFTVVDASSTTTGTGSIDASGSTTSTSASTTTSTTRSSSSTSFGVTHSNTITGSSTSSVTSSSPSTSSTFIPQSFNAAARSAADMGIAGALAAVLGCIIAL